MTIPDGLPRLARGAHHAHEGEACIMEYVSLLAGEVWGDGPECTLPLVAQVARHVNDTVGDKTRQRLYALVPRLLTANVEGLPQQQAVSKRLMERTVARHHGVAVHYNGLANQWRGIVGFYVARDGYNFLVEVLDEFDRIVGEQKRADVTAEQYAQATAAVHAPQDETQVKVVEAKSPSGMLLVKEPVLTSTFVPSWSWTPFS